MSRLVPIIIAGLLSLAVAVPSVAAATTINTGGSVTVAQIDWAISDPGSFTGGFLVAAKDAKGAPIVEYFLVVEKVVQCEGGETPDDPEDDRWDFQLRYEYGIGSARTFTIDKSYSGASASAVLDIVVDRFDGCTGELSTETLSNVDIALRAVGNGPLVRESGHGSFHIPGEYNAHGSFKTTYRSATGIASIGALTFDGEAVVGTVSWRDHVNAR